MLFTITVVIYLYTNFPHLMSVFSLIAGLRGMIQTTSSSVRHVLIHLLLCSVTCPSFGPTCAWTLCFSKILCPT